MDEEMKAKLIAQYWDAYDKSDLLRNYQRAMNDVNHDYYAGIEDALSEVFEALGIDPEVGIPDAIRIDRAERLAKSKAQWDALRQKFEKPDSWPMGEA